MGDLVVLKDPSDLADRVRLPDVRQELVAQAFALGGAAHNPGDVDELDCRRQFLLRAEDLGQLAQPRIRHPDHADIRLDRRERIVGRENIVLGQSVEEC